MGANFLIKTGECDNTLIENCMQIDCAQSVNQKFKPPQMLKYLIDNNMIWDDNNNVILYHKRYNSENNDPVYNISQ